MRRLRVRCCASRTNTACVPTLDFSKPTVPSSISRNRDVGRRRLFRTSRLAVCLIRSCRLIGSQQSTVRSRSILQSFPQQLKQGKEVYGMAKRHCARHIRKLAANSDGQGLVPVCRNEPYRDGPAVPKLRRRPPMPRHQLHRHSRQTSRWPTGSNRLAPSSLSSTMLNLRMCHYL